MKRNAMPLAILFILLMLPAWASAGSVQGSVQGYTCVTQGKVCPVGKEDPLIAVEKVFVILTRSKSYYFVPNLDRGILARHINQEVKVTGRINNVFPSIIAKRLDVMKRGKWRIVWTPRQEREIRKDLGLDYGGF